MEKVLPNTVDLNEAIQLTENALDRRAWEIYGDYVLRGESSPLFPKNGFDIDLVKSRPDIFVNDLFIRGLTFRIYHEVFLHGKIPSTIGPLVKAIGLALNTARATDAKAKEEFDRNPVAQHMDLFIYVNSNHINPMYQVIRPLFKSEMAARKAAVYFSYIYVACCSFGPELINLMMLYNVKDEDFVTGRDSCDFYKAILGTYGLLTSKNVTLTYLCVLASVMAITPFVWNWKVDMSKAAGREAYMMAIVSYICDNADQQTVELFVKKYMTEASQTLQTLTEKYYMKEDKLLVTNALLVCAQNNKNGRFDKIIPYVG